MSTPYQNDFLLVKAGAPAETFDLDWPGRCELTRISVMEEDAVAIDVDFFNRKLIGGTLAIATILDDGNTKCLITLAAGVVFTETEIKVDDLITVAGSSVGGYNVATHRVTFISEDRRQAITSVAYTADATGGTANLDLTVIEAVYRVMPNIAGASPQLSFPPATGDAVLFINSDPLGNLNIGINRKLYLRINGGAGTYRLGLSALLGVAGEG